MPDAIKPGYKTTEFWATVILQVISAAALIGVVQPSDAPTLTEHLTKMVVSIFALTVSGSAVFAYLKARVAVKNK